ncbi:S1 family peptidase [Rhodohalobacter halophilus]|uniref:S1 family peptidase n=1 Tax=Rhodohalobacter halophilus TaxID=1812810 RepID=UPI00159F27DF|nr:serine protease [Rhodohalobacter halophilus]
MKRSVWWLLIALFIGLGAGCTQTYEVTVDDLPETDPFYTSGYPIADVSDQIESIQQSIIRITSTARYRVYLIEDGINMTSAEADTINPAEFAMDQTTVEESSAGSAIVMGKTADRAMLLTCAHTVEFPERVFSFKAGPGIPENTYVRTIAVKQNHVNMALTDRTLAPYSLVQEDRIRDLALIQINLRDFEQIGEDLNPLKVPMGYSENLRSGSVIYVMGYPKGFETVTRGIVTQANRNDRADFLTDALYNRGISGGIIVASKDNFKTFDWVGMSNAGIATREFYLVPDEQQLDPDLSYQFYDGSIMAKEIASLDYGLTQAISTRSIREFLDQNRSVLRSLDRSYRLPQDN